MIIELSNDKLDFVIESLKENGVFLKKAYTVSYVPETFYNGRRVTTEAVYNAEAILIDEKTNTDLLVVKKGNSVRRNIISKKIYEKAYTDYFLLDDDVASLLKNTFIVKLDESNLNFLKEKEFESYKNIKNISGLLCEIAKKIERKSGCKEEVAEADFFFKNRERLNELGLTILHLGMRNNYGHLWYNSSIINTTTSIVPETLLREYVNYAKDNNIIINDNKYINMGMSLSESLVLDSIDNIANTVNNNSDLLNTRWGELTTKIISLLFKYLGNTIYSNLPLLQKSIDILNDSEFGDEINFKNWILKNKIYEKEFKNFWIEEKYKYKEILMIDKRVLLDTFPSLFKNVNVSYGSSKNNEDLFLKMMGTIFKDGLEMGYNLTVTNSFSDESEFIINLQSNDVIDKEKIKKLINEIVKDLLTEQKFTDYVGNKEDCLNRLNKLVLKQMVVEKSNTTKKIKF